MSRLTELRGKLNFTQQELAQKSGVSVRTIQRIEAGGQIKGHTLNVISEALNVNKSDLIIKKDSERNNNDIPFLKLINFSSLPFVMIPLASIFVPILIIFLKKKNLTSITKQIISIQILWNIFSALIIVLSAFFKKWFSLGNHIILITIISLIIINLFIIIRNAIEIDRKSNLHIKLFFSVL